MIEYVDLNHAEELDEFVWQHKNCHFMQSSLWGNVKTDWEWHGLICRDDRGRIRGTMALLRHDIPAIKTSLLYAPRGPILHEKDREVFRDLVGTAYMKSLHRIWAFTLIAARISLCSSPECATFWI